MGQLAAETGLVPLDDEQRAIVETVRDFVEKEVIPVADELEHRDEFPEKIVEGMKELGLFGLTVPEEFDKAEAILEAYEHATDVDLTGAVMFGTEMIDEASRKMAEQVAQRGRAAGMSREAKLEDFTAPKDEG